MFTILPIVLASAGAAVMLIGWIVFGNMTARHARTTCGFFKGRNPEDVPNDIWLEQLAGELGRLQSEAEDRGIKPVGDLLQMVQQEVICLRPQARQPPDL